MNDIEVTFTKDGRKIYHIDVNDLPPKEAMKIVNKWLEANSKEVAK